MARNKSVMAMGNALTDVVIKVDESVIEKLGLKKGCYHRDVRLDFDSMNKEKIIQGGSPSNVVADMSFLGLEDSTGLIGTIGRDDIGKLYRANLVENKVIDYLSCKDGSSGVCYLLVTPDGERTSVVNMGVCEQLEPPLEEIEKFKVFHTSSYEVTSNPKKTMEALLYAYGSKVPISFDLGDELLVKNNRSLMEGIVRHSTIVFANERESKAFTGLDPEASVERINSMQPNIPQTCSGQMYTSVAVVKLGGKGSLVKESGRPTARIQPYKVRVVDTTGAGDAYAAGFLYGMVQGLCASDCGEIGSWMGSKICEVYGPRFARN